MQVYARHSLTLVHLAAMADGAILPETELLLEGSWPCGEGSVDRLSLDDAIDGRYAAIDEQAEQLAANEAASPGWRLASPDRATTLSLAWLNGLRLRYELVKLLRVESFLLDVHPLAPCEHVRFHGEPGRDNDYAELLAAICSAANATLEVAWHGEPNQATARLTLRKPRWRRWLATLIQSASPNPANDSPLIAFCGNRQLLDPVCEALLARGCGAAWIYEQFAFGCWRRWRRNRVAQWLCAGPSGEAWKQAQQTTRQVGEESPNDAGRLAGECDGGRSVAALFTRAGHSTSKAVAAWMTRVSQQHGVKQSIWLARLDEHFSRCRPAALVLDEDATPLARAAVAIARRHGVPSLVLQHGAPYGRFGFAPLAADRLLAWGESSRRRFVEFGIAPAAMEVVGSPKIEENSPANSDRHGVLCAPSGARRVLFLATNPPQDDRPDAIAFHLTTRSHRELLRRLFGSVQQLGNAELVIKLHPRCRENQVFQQVAAEFPGLRCRIARGGRLTDWVATCDCVVSCGSTAGIQATLGRRPVIELLDVGSADLLAPAAWGLWGVARDQAELDRLLRAALHANRDDLPASRPQVFAHLGPSAASAAADAVLRSIVERSDAPSTTEQDAMPAPVEKAEGDTEYSESLLPGSASPTEALSWAKLTRDLTLVGGSTVACQMLGVVTSLLLRAMLDPAQIGLWQGLRLWLGLSNYASLGAGKAAARDLSLALGRGDSSANRSLALANTVNLAASTLLAVLLAGAAGWRALSSSAGWRDAWALGLLFVAVLALLQRQVTFRITLLRSRQNFRLATRISLLEGSLSLVVSAAAAWAWGVSGLCLSALIVLLASWTVLRRYDRTSLGLAWNTREIGRLVGIGLPLMLAGLAATLFATLDRWLILAWLPDGEYQLGCYTLALLVSAQVLGAGGCVSIVSGPRYAQVFGRTGSRRHVALLAARISEIQATMLGGLCGLAVLACGPLLAWLLPKYEPGLAPLAWLMPGALAASLAAPLGQYLAAVADGRRMLAPLLAGIAVAGSGVSCALQGGLGILGAAAFMTVAQFICLAISLVLSIWPQLSGAERRRYLLVIAWSLLPTLIPLAFAAWTGLLLWFAWCSATATVAWRHRPTSTVWHWRTNAQTAGATVAKQSV